MRRLTLLVMALILLLGACTGGGETTAVRTYHSDPITFRYPASWTARHYDEASSFRSYWVYLSNQPMVTPCRTTSSGPAGETFSTECGWPVEHLEPGGVLAWWSSNSSLPGASPIDATGEALTVGGRPAKLSITPGCHDIDGEVSMTAVVEIPNLAQDWNEFDACIRGPGVAQVEAQVRALLASTRFPKGG